MPIAPLIKVHLAQLLMNMYNRPGLRRSTNSKYIMEAKQEGREQII